MLANYGYTDASGNYTISIDTDRCDGCGDCVVACPSAVLIITEEDPNDPLRDEPVALVNRDKMKKLNYECTPCKPSTGRAPLPCVTACAPRAIKHSW